MTVQIKADFYREHTYNLSPPFMRGTLGERLVGYQGLQLDIIAEATHRSVLARWIYSPELPDDAVSRIGDERSMPRYPIESSADHLARLKEAWNAWAEAGTDKGMIKRFAELGLTVTIQENHTWDWDGDSDYWSRFWVVIATHPWSGPPTWDSPGIWDDGGVWDVSASQQEVETLRSIVRRWKPARMICDSIIVVHTPGSWSGTPDGTWDQWANRDTGAAYISG